MQNLTLAAVSRDRVIWCIWEMQNLPRSHQRAAIVSFCTSRNQPHAG